MPPAPAPAPPLFPMMDASGSSSLSSNNEELFFAEEGEACAEGSDLEGVFGVDEPTSSSNDLLLLRATVGVDAVEEVADAVLPGVIEENMSFPPEAESSEKMESQADFFCGVCSLAANNCNVSSDGTVAVAGCSLGLGFFS